MSLQKNIIKFKLAGRNWHTTTAFIPLLQNEILPRMDKTCFFHIRRHRKAAMIDTSEGRYFIKMYLVHSRLSQAIDFTMQRTRARTEWINHLAVWETGVPSPEPFAFSEKLPLSLNYTSLLVMRAMEPDLISLRQAVTTLPDVELLKKRQGAYREAIRFLARMHEKGMYHMDFTDVNIYGEVVDGIWSPSMVIDFEKYTAGAPEDDKLAFASLTRASQKLKGVSNDEAMRFLCYYLKCRGIFNTIKRKTGFSHWLRESAKDMRPEKII